MNKIPTTAYAPLLATIAVGESNGNYNAYYGKGDNTAIRFTDMTINEVLQWQEQYVAAGSPSSAVGRYQIIRPTMLGLIAELDVDRNAKFDPVMQDRLAVALLERRGSKEYANDQLSREQFAANLAKEWAALPQVVGEKPNESFYAGDGLNSARISVDQIFAAIQAFKTKV